MRCAPPLPGAASVQVARWEEFLNSATRRPYDAPGAERFWYRLQPIEATIVHKTPIVYPLSTAKMHRLSELFLESDWQPTRLPGHEAEQASNPFVSFDQIPARSRYQFLLDDARYFVMTFIRGPVCRGQVAVDVIQDDFFVAFLPPEHRDGIRASWYKGATDDERYRTARADNTGHGTRIRFASPDVPAELPEKIVGRAERIFKHAQLMTQRIAASRDESQAVQAPRSAAPETVV